MHAVRMNTHRRRKFGSKPPHLRGVAQEIEYPCEIRVIRFGFVVTKRLGTFGINTNNVRFSGMRKNVWHLRATCCSHLCTRLYQDLVHRLIAGATRQTLIHQLLQGRDFLAALTRGIFACPCGDKIGRVHPCRAAPDIQEVGGFIRYFDCLAHDASMLPRQGMPVTHSDTHANRSDEVSPMAEKRHGMIFSWVKLRLLASTQASISDGS